ncbi:MAG: hypothetical protein Q7U56_14485, partial [Humidesulfovibrio sp.]|nr:hypothetical protein [Humidesulfovibrio sp.]
MLLTKLNYYENESQPDEWQIEDLTLGSQNLIVGRNATGKTRLYRVISNFSKIITESMPYLNGRFDLTFTDSDVSYNYSIKITNGKVEYEYYRRDETLLISRDNTAMQIIHILNGEEQLREISPPENKLVIHVRRDNKEFPYIEMLHEWAGNIVSIRFIEQQSNSVRATAENASTVLDKDGTIYY